MCSDWSKIEEVFYQGWLFYHLTSLGLSHESQSMLHTSDKIKFVLHVTDKFSLLMNKCWSLWFLPNGVLEIECRDACMMQL